MPVCDMRGGLTPPCLTKGMAWNADRGPDPPPQQQESRSGAGSRPLRLMIRFKLPLVPRRRGGPVDRYGKRSEIAMTTSADTRSIAEAPPAKDSGARAAPPPLAPYGLTSCPISEKGPHVMLSKTLARLSLYSAVIAAMLTFSMAPASAFPLSSPSLEPSFADSRIEKVYYYYGYRHYYHPYYHNRYYHHPYYRHRYYYHP